MANKLKWFAAGFLARSLLSGSKKETFSPEEKERKLREYDDFLSSHPLLTKALYIVIIAVLAVVFVKALLA